MKILMICFVYNELKYLPHTIDYYRKNGCEIYIIDNYSNDGTWEWLQDNNIPCHRVDTKESFDLRILQREIMVTLPKLNPDWVIYAGADLYYIARIPLRAYIEKVDSMGFNQLSMMCWSAFNTGEEYGLPLPKYFHYAAPWRNITMISRYNDSYNMNGDNVTIDNSLCYIAKHAIVINYGACKPREEQEVKLARRTKAWENGMRAQQGVHYLKGKERNWIRSKEELIDLRSAPEYNFIQRLLTETVSSSSFDKGNYDKMYVSSTVYKKHYRDTVYYPIWKYIAAKLMPGDKVLDLGCGPGQMANLLHDKGIRCYTGVDFSRVAIEMASKNAPSFTFLESDLNDIDYTRYSGHIIISTETFEHLASDIELIKKLPKGHIIFSVPNFMCSTHYRTYDSEKLIREYYQGVLKIESVKEFAIGANRIIFVVEAEII